MVYTLYFEAESEDDLRKSGLLLRMAKPSTRKLLGLLVAQKAILWLMIF